MNPLKESKSGVLNEPNLQAPVSTGIPPRIAHPLDKATPLPKDHTISPERFTALKTMQGKMR